jgi:cytokinin riboside 5'-monophosphate phosphoribohydrolase
MPTNICVYCSSSDIIDRRFFQVAQDLGAQIGQRGDTLIYGGGKVGLMGEVARACHEHGGRVVGVIPESLKTVELAYELADELIVTETMSERKTQMFTRGDAFVILPGGFGTLEELAEVLVLKILKYQHRPIIILNCHGFYDPLVDLFNHFIEQNFAKPKHRELYDVVTTVEEVVTAIDVAKV